MWEISITAEGWQEISDQLHDPGQWTVKQLSEALSDDDMSRAEEENIPDPLAYAQLRKRTIYLKLPHDTLADQALTRVEENNTCDNGGYAYWIDREGYHKVHLYD